MHSLTSCCKHEGARQGITPYQRLPRSHSTSSHRDISPDTPTHHSQSFACACLEPKHHKSYSFGHNASSSKSRQCEHDSGGDELCSASPCVNVHSHSDHVRRGCSSDRATTTVSSSTWQSHEDSIPRRTGNAKTLVNTVNTSQMQGGRSLIEQGTKDMDTVLVKIGIIGDSGTGKTSFMARYGGVELQNDAKDVALLQKLCKLRHVNIALHIWDLGGQWQYLTKLPLVCKDAATIFIMFDLTRRSTLQSVKKWYLCAREFNKVAVIVLIGTKYDGFVQLSKEFQSIIIQEASNHSKKMKASLFFSSVTYNINVHKVFKVAIAKIFDLPCRVTQNFNSGEPIVSY